MCVLVRDRAHPAQDIKDGKWARGIVDAFGASVYASRKFAIRCLLVQLFIGQDARAAKRRRTRTREIDKDRRYEAETIG